MAYIDEIEVNGQGVKYAISGLIDTSNNARFIEGDGTDQSGEGITVSYNKWSLSGTHLMLVLAGTIDNGTTIDNPKIKSVFTLPEWILDKIYPVIGNYLKIETTGAYGTAGQITTFGYLCFKGSSSIAIESYGNTAIERDSGFRIQVDLLIDSASA